MEIMRKTLYKSKNVNVINNLNGDRFLLFVTGTFAENIIILNVDKLEYNTAHFNNLSSIEIAEIRTDDSYIGVVVIGSLFDQNERKWIDRSAIVFSCNSPSKVSNMFKTGTYSVISKGNKYNVFIDVDIHEDDGRLEIKEEMNSTFDNDDEMGVLSVTENAFFKEFHELMDKISSSILSYEASLNMIQNDRIKICSFIDGINEIVEKYNK